MTDIALPTFPKRCRSIRSIVRFICSSVAAIIVNHNLFHGLSSYSPVTQRNLDQEQTVTAVSVHGGENISSHYAQEQNSTVVAVKGGANVSSPYAYVFMMFRVDPTEDGSTKSDRGSFKPYVANMMVAAELFRSLGSTSDVVAMISMKSGYDRLPDDVARLVTESGVKIRYFTPTVADEEGGFVTGQMNKIEILNMLDYRRILYLDCDVIPLANLDYMFHLSETTMKPNIILATKATPLIGGFFVLEPSAQGYQEARRLVQKKIADSDKRFDRLNGWGVNLTGDNAAYINGGHLEQWEFLAANGDQGLLYHYVRFVQRNVSQILSDRVIHYGPGPMGTTVYERMDEVSQTRSLFRTLTVHRPYAFFNPTCKQMGCCYPGPYRDHAHFMGGGATTGKPWRHPQPERFQDRSKSPRDATHLWWKTLFELEDRLGFDYTSEWLPPPVHVSLSDRWLSDGTNVTTNHSFAIVAQQEQNNDTVVSVKGGENSTNHHSLGIVAQQEQNGTVVSVKVGENVSSPYAYVFMMFRVDPTEDGSTKSDRGSFKPYVANILVAAELFRFLGSTSDVVAMISMKSGYDSLPEDVARLLTESGVKIRYFTPSVADEKGGFVTGQMNKIEILNMLEYRRILYLDCDVIPLANLDYMFNLSETTMKPNIILATKATPLIGGFFLLEPTAEGYQEAKQLVQKRVAEIGKGFDRLNGWGVNLTDDNAAHINGGQYDRWNFLAADGDQGLLYHYARFVRRNVTQILFDQVIHYGPGPMGSTVIERIDEVSTARTPFRRLPVYRPFAFVNPTCQQMGFCYAGPYRDHAHFMGAGTRSGKPWRYPHPERFQNRTEEPSHATHLWWKTLYELEDRLGFNYTSQWLQPSVNATM